MGSVRPPAVAGSFYPGDASRLDATVQGFLAAVADSQEPVPKAVIAPHAGYVYSGPIAATAYARLKPAAGTITRVVLLGPCHRVAVRGLALSSAAAFATPLGEIPIDRQACEEILKLPQVHVLDAPHAEEHSLEVHLPFLQVVLGDFSLVPLAVGEASANEVADVIDRLWGGPETLIVVSTDLSHFLEYGAAQRLDADTCRAIENLEPAAIGREQACGRTPVRGLLKLARRRRLKVATVDLRNSGDTAGDKNRVVGYGSWVFTEDGFADRTQTLLDNHGTTLLRLAASSIEYGLAHQRVMPVKAADYPSDLGELGACFVTLYRSAKLRGCIGSPAARRPLVEDVVHNAYAAAFGDRRFNKLTPEELDGLELSVSVLSPQSPIDFRGEDDLISKLRPGVDGLVIEDKGRRALYLPSVWESLPLAKNFLVQLKVKAGLAADHWSENFKAWRFVALEAKAKELDDPDSIWSNR